MATLKRPSLGTDQVSGWAYYALHEATSYILKEYFLVSNYKTCIKNSFKMHDETKRIVDAFDKAGRSLPNKDYALNHSRELSDWCREMESEGYHELYVHSFVGMWSAFESGIENTFRDFLLNDREAANLVSTLFGEGNKYPIADWPWDREVCLEIAQKIEPKAKSKTANGGLEFFDRLSTAFSWLGISLSADSSVKAGLNEANRMRNILMHRYGEISQKDAEDFPTFGPWVGKVMPITRGDFDRYYHGISGILIAITNGTARKFGQQG